MTVIDSKLPGVLVQDAWEMIDERLREEFVTRRAASTTWGAYGRQKSDSRRWEPLRPIVLTEHAYGHLESILARLLSLAVQSCQRRAATVGELHQALRFRNHLPLMDPDRPLVASELTRYARPDLLIEQGRPRLLEFNNSTRLGGDTVTPRLAAAFAGVCPQAGLRPPPSVVTARSEALIRTLNEARTDSLTDTGTSIGSSTARRLLIPTYSALDDAGTRHRYDKVKKPVLDDARRVGFEVVQADLANLRLDAASRLLADDVPIDVVLIQWGSGEAARITDDGGGLAALRTADRAGTIGICPRTESVLISSKAVLAWLHEDCDTGLLTPADRDLVRTYVPRTVCLGLREDSSLRDGHQPPAINARDELVVKPTGGKSGAGVLFGRHTSQDDWLSATHDAARETPVVLQQRVEPDHIMMPFLDRDSGSQVTAQVPFVLSPFMVDGAAASVGVRHMSPDTPTGDVVISVSRGARSNTVVLI